MTYTLTPEPSTAAQPILSQDLPDKFAAERWAVTWARDHAKDDTYLLQGDGGAFKAKLFRTGGGQWYVTPAH